MLTTSFDTVTHGSGYFAVTNSNGGFREASLTC